LEGLKIIILNIIEISTPGIPSILKETKEIYPVKCISYFTGARSIRIMTSEDVTPEPFFEGLAPKLCQAVRRLVGVFRTKIRTS
jgi:hypothetical protein